MTTQVDLGIAADGRNVLIVDGAQIDNLPGLRAAAPDLTPAALARAVNHLAVGHGFSVIDDLVAYAQQVRARIEGEAADAAWQEGVFRLRDHGVPDVKALAVPAVSDGRLVYFAADSLIGAPYRVEVDLGGAAPTEDAYAAEPLRPLPPTAATPAADPLFVGATGDVQKYDPDFYAASE
jgi:hypothetical protein